MKKELWAAAVNFAGCDDKPIRVKLDKESNGITTLVANSDFMHMKCLLMEGLYLHQK